MKFLIFRCGNHRDCFFGANFGTFSATFFFNIYITVFGDIYRLVWRRRSALWSALARPLILRLLRHCIFSSPLCRIHFAVYSVDQQCCCQRSSCNQHFSSSFVNFTHIIKRFSTCSRTMFVRYICNVQKPCVKLCILAQLTL